jgi:hypothetical protein
MFPRLRRETWDCPRERLPGFVQVYRRRSGFNTWTVSAGNRPGIHRLPDKTVPGLKTSAGYIRPARHRFFRCA